MIGTALGLRLSGGAAAVALIVAGYHFTPVVGPAARLGRAGEAMAAKDAALRKAAASLRLAAEDIRQRDQLINDRADLERNDAGQTAAFWKGQCRHAFDAGYAARRCGGGDDADGVRDLRALQAAGAFKAGP